MRPSRLHLPLVLAGMAMAAPQAAMAKLDPSFLKVEDAGWTLVKYSTSRGGKLKIYTELPKYTVLGKIETEPAGELKALYSRFNLEAGRKYWIVFFPKYTRVSQMYVLAKGTGAKGESYNTDYQLFVTGGQYHAFTWTTTPKFKLFVDGDNPKVIKLSADNFEKGKKELPLITILKRAEQGAGTGSTPSAPGSDEAKAHEFEIKLRKAKNLNAEDPEGSTPESLSGMDIAGPRDYWRLGISGDKAFHDSDLEAKYKSMSIVYDPKKNGNSKEAMEISKYLNKSFERMRWETVEGEKRFEKEHPEKDDEE